MNVAKELHVYVSCTAPNVMRVYFCTSATLNPEELPSQDQLAQNVIQRLDKQSFEDAVGEERNPRRFTSHVGVIRVDDDGVTYNINSSPKTDENRAKSTP